MKATGIVRRIDDLGRVVIPKEIRRVLRIREGDPLEIYTNNSGEVILKKYSPKNELSHYASEYDETAANILGASVVISDTDQVMNTTLDQFLHSNRTGSSTYSGRSNQHFFALICALPATKFPV